MNGFDVVAQCLKAEGVDWLACFPANPLIEACAKADIRPIVFRQERGGINAADGFSRQNAGKKIGVFAAQDGPGVENSFGGVAQAWGATLPTTAIVDAIYQRAETQLTPAPIAPGPHMRSMRTILQHRDLIRRELGGFMGLTAGHKKDVVLTGRYRTRPDRVAIYGWHRPDGRPIQPLSTVHGASYADYGCSPRG